MAAETHYEVLGVAPTASPEEVASAYHRLARLTHPDVGGTNPLFHRVNVAYETLRDPGRRASYDRALRMPGGSGVPGGPGSGAGWDADGREEWVHVDDPAPGWTPHPDAGDGASESGPDAPPGSSPGPWTWRTPWAWRTPWTWWAPWATRQGRWGSSARARAGLSGWWDPGQPWQVVVLAGLVLCLVVARLGLPVLLLGSVAAVGARRAHRREALRTAGFPSIDRMDGTTFEYYVGELLRAGGGRVRHVGGTGDFGADLVVERAGQRVVVQTKRYAQPVGVAAVQQAVAARAHYGADFAMVVTNSSFTPAARLLAESNRVQLWDRLAVAAAASHAAMVPRYAPVRRFGAELWAGVGVLARWLLIALGALVALAVVTGLASRRRRRRSRR